MKKTGKWMAVAASAALSFSLIAPGASAATTFPDVKKGQMHSEAIYELAERKVIQGYPDGLFKPNRDVTRGQAAKMLALALELDTKNVTNPNFKDIPTSNQYYGPIAALAQEGIITGDPTTNTYNPNAKLTRGQMSKIIALAYNLPVAKWTGTPFKDVNTKQWYHQYVQALYDFKITTGTTPTTYSPKSNVRRGQMSSFIIRTEAIDLGQKIDTGISVVITDQINSNKDIPLQGTFNADKGTVAFKVTEQTAKVSEIENSGVFEMIPYADLTSAKLNDSNTNLAAISPGEAKKAVYEALGITADSPLSALVGKTVTFKLSSPDGDYDYTFTFGN